MIDGIWTVWGKDPETQQEIWYWCPPVLPVEADRAQLLAAQWMPIHLEHQHTLFLTLVGQLSEIHYVKTAEAEQMEVWAHGEDITSAEQIPVVLAFYLPEQVRKVTQTALQQSMPSDSLPLLVGETLAPTRIGEVALVADSQAGGWRSYPLHLLGEEGRILRQQIQQIIREFAADARREHQRRRAGSAPLSSHSQVEREARYSHLHTLAQRLAMLYWRAHQERMEQIAEASPTRSLPQTLYVFDKGTIIPAPQPVQAVLAAYSSAQSNTNQWEHTTGIPTFVYHKEHGITSIEIRPSDQDIQLDDSLIQSLWNQVLQLSDIDGDVLLAMLAQAIATPHDEKDGVWITGKLILDYRGIEPIKKRMKNGQKRKAGYRLEDLADVAACVSRMGNTWIRVEQWIADDETPQQEPGGKRPKKRRKPYLYTRESRLINITDVIRQHELRRESGVTQAQNTLAVAWRYQLGSWIDPFLQGANRQVAWLLQQALSYDPYHETWEKRLARYFTFQMRLDVMKGGVVITREIGVLLQELSLPCNYRDPERTRQRFEKAMTRLQEDELISGWGYHQENPPLPARKWLYAWLTHSIWVTAAPLPSEMLLQDPPSLPLPLQSEPEGSKKTQE